MCRFRVDSGIVIVNVGTVTSGGYAADDDGCQVVQFDDVGIEKVHELLPEEEGRRTSVEPGGDEHHYVLTVNDYGTRAGENVVVTDPLDGALLVTGLVLPTGWTNRN